MGQCGEVSHLEFVLEKGSKRMVERGNRNRRAETEQRPRVEVKF